MPVNFGATNIASSSSLGKRSRGANGRDDDGESGETGSLRSQSPELADAAAADDDFRSALDTLNTLRRQDDAAMDALLDAVREQQRQLDSLQSIILDSYQKRRQEYAEMQSTVFNLQRRYGGGKSRDGGGSSSRKGGSRSVQDRFESLGLASPRMVKNTNTNSKDPADFRKSAIGLVTPTKQRERDRDRDVDDAMEVEAAERSSPPKTPTVPSHLRNKAKRTPQNRGMFAIPREVSAQSPAGSAVRKARGLREQSPKKYYQPIDLGDDDDSLYHDPSRPTGSRRSINPWELTPSQTRARNVEVVAKALSRGRHQQQQQQQQQGGPADHPGQNGIYEDHSEQDSSNDILASLNAEYPPQNHPTWNMIPQQSKLFSRPNLTKLIGGRIQDTLVNVKKDTKYIVKIPQYLALKTQGNPFLPATTARHGVIYLPREYNVNPDAILPLFVCKGQGAWAYMGGYKLSETSPLPVNEWAKLSQSHKTFWARTISETKWGTELLGRYGISKETMSVPSVWKLLNAPDNEKHIRLRRQVLRFVEYDRAFYDIIAAASDELESAEQQAAQVPTDTDRAKYSQQEFVPTQSGSHSPRDDSAEASYVEGEGEEEDSFMDDVIPP